jgi:hypothetical protein
LRWSVLRPGWEARKQTSYILYTYSMCEYVYVLDIDCDPCLYACTGPNTTLGCSLCCDSMSHVEITCLSIPKRSYSRLNPKCTVWEIAFFSVLTLPCVISFRYSVIIVKWNFCAVSNENVGLGEVIIQPNSIPKLHRRYMSLGKCGLYMPEGNS